MPELTRVERADAEEFLAEHPRGSVEIVELTYVCNPRDAYVDPEKLLISQSATKTVRLRDGKLVVT